MYGQKLRRRRFELFFIFANDGSTSLTVLNIPKATKCHLSLPLNFWDRYLIIKHFLCCHQHKLTLPTWWNSWEYIYEDMKCRYNIIHSLVRHFYGRKIYSGHIQFDTDICGESIYFSKRKKISQIQKMYYKKQCQVVKVQWLHKHESIFLFSFAL